jgi:hypothetical protein
MFVRRLTIWFLVFVTSGLVGLSVPSEVYGECNSICIQREMKESIGRMVRQIIVKSIKNRTLCPAVKSNKYCLISMNWLFVPQSKCVLEPVALTIMTFNLSVLCFYKILIILCFLT